MEFAQKRSFLPRTLAALIVSAAVLGSVASTAEARCPKNGSPSRDVCKYSNSILMPSVQGRAYVPGDGALGPWYGGGVQLVLFTWSDNSDRFGPGQGKLFFDMGVLASGEEMAGKMVMYRGGANVSFERNASRSWLIPYFGATVGGMHESNVADHGFVEGLVGLHAWYSANLIIDVEGGYLFPFSDAERLAGMTAQLSVSLSLW